MLQAQFNKAANGRTAVSPAHGAAPPRAPADSPPGPLRLRSFAEAASRPLLPRTDSDYLAFLDTCSALYARMDGLADRVDALDRTAAAVLRTLERLARDRQEALEHVQARAATIRHGQRVYITRDARQGFHENGDPMTRREFALTKWVRRCALWEDYRAAHDRLQRSLDAHEDVRSYRSRLDRYRRAMLQDEPLLGAALDDLERDLIRMPDDVRRAWRGPAADQHSAARAYTGEHGLPGAPSLITLFNASAALPWPTTDTGDRTGIVRRHHGRPGPFRP